MTDSAPNTPDDGSSSAASGPKWASQLPPTLRLTVDPYFGPFFAGKFVSNVGIWIHHLAAAVVVFQLTGSAAWVGAIGVGQFLPQVLIAPWSGARADRSDRRLQLLAGRIVGGTGSASLVLLPFWMSFGDRVAAVAVVAGSAILGVGFALGGPALHALVPQLVRPPDLAAAITLNTLPITISRALGPAFGALIVASLGPEVAFMVAASGNYVFALALLRTRARPDATVVDKAPPSGQPIRDGLRHIRSQPALRSLLFAVAIIGFATEPVVTLSPSLAARLGGEAELVGALVSAFGIGAGLGLVAAGMLRRRIGIARTGPLGILLLAVGYMSAGQAGTALMAVLALGIAGSGMSIGLTSLTTRLQQIVTESYRGRIMAAWSIAFLGTRPLSASSVGLLADFAGVTTAFLLVGTLCFLGAGWVLRAVRHATPVDGTTTDTTDSMLAGDDRED